MMKNDLLKFVPSVLVLVALGLLFIPKHVSYLDVERFFASTNAYYQRADKGALKAAKGRREDYYYPGVHIGKLWRKLGIVRELERKGAARIALKDEYLFGCGTGDYGACVLAYPVVKEYALGEYRALRISSASARFPDYQYLLFKDIKGGWVYFGHIDVFDNKTGEPVFRLLDNGLASVVSLAGMGDGYSTNFMQVYRLDGDVPKLLLAVPSEASRRGIGLLNFEVTSIFDYTKGELSGNYRITFMAEQGAGGRPARQAPLFTAVRHVTLAWDGKDLVYDETRSDITPTELARIVSGSYARIYEMFRADFDKLKKADVVKRGWFAEFMAVVQEQGVTFSVPLPVSRRL